MKKINILGDNIYENENKLKKFINKIDEKNISNLKFMILYAKYLNEVKYLPDQSQVILNMLEMEIEKTEININSLVVGSDFMKV